MSKPLTEKLLEAVAHGAYTPETPQYCIVYLNPKGEALNVYEPVSKTQSSRHGLITSLRMRGFEKQSSDVYFMNDGKTNSYYAVITDVTDIIASIIKRAQSARGEWRPPVPLKRANGQPD